MIDPRELMLGCYVQLNNNVPREVIGITDHAVIIQGDRGAHELPLGIIMPLAVSMDLLGKLGFNIKNAYDCVVFHCTNGAIEFTACFDDEDGVKPVAVFNYRSYWDNTHKQVELEYIHQLQIFMFSLTGTMPQLKRS